MRSRPGRDSCIRIGKEAEVAQAPGTDLPYRIPCRGILFAQGWEFLATTRQNSALIVPTQPNTDSELTPKPAIPAINPSNSVEIQTSASAPVYFQVDSREGGRDRRRQIGNALHLPAKNASASLRYKER